MLSQRLIFGAIFIAALIGLIYADQALARSAGSCLIVIPILVILIALGTIELAKLFKMAGHQPLVIWPLIINTLLIVAPRADASRDWTLMILVFGMLGAFFLILPRKRTEGAIAALATTLFAILYLGLLPQFLIRIRLLQPQTGAWVLLYVIATIKISDIGAYFTGRFLGRHKLIEWLSPKKTIEGLLGGVAASVIMAVVYPLIAGSGDLHAGLGLNLNWPRAIVFGMVMALAGQAGDLLESLIKRDAQAKDSAAAVPAFGGILDIIDSLLLTAPLAYWLLLG